MRRIGCPKSLCGVQGSRRVVAPPIGDTIGSVGALLHLPDEEAGHECVKAAGWNVEHITTVYRVPRKEWGDVGARGQRARDVGTRH